LELAIDHAERRFVMKRVLVMLCVLVVGSAIEARADGHGVRGGITGSRTPSGAGVDAQQQRPVKMRFSGTNVAIPINLQPGTVTDETHLAGNGTHGAFTFRELHADGPSPQPPAGCFSTRYFAVVAGAGVFRFQDGSLLVVTVRDGSGCINLAAGNSALTVNYEISGGTGRFTGASGHLTMTATIAPVLRNASGAPALLTNTGELEGTIVGAALEEERQDERL
jgi:hypothetical protein